ncbi:MAG: hypothetical protein OHK0013_06800 [Sandaracinaceae bacterium]
MYRSTSSIVSTSVLAAAAVAGLTVVGCSCDSGTGDGDAGPGGLDAFVDPTLDANLDAFVDPTVDAHSGPDAFLDPTVDANLDAWLDPTVDAGPGSCRIAQCDGRTYQCGDCRDNDGDGLGDARDPGCLGPCDNTEDVYDIGIGDTATCLVDCYFDQDQGPGNDGCRYDQSCDMLEPDAPTCPYSPPAMCDRIEGRCGTVCGPLVPNGCDCFGCCELPGGSGNFVYLGSVPLNGAPACSPETATNPDSCRPCTPVRVEGCFNECGRCELCLGRTELPPECFPPPPIDASVPMGVDAGPPPDAFTPDSGVPVERCPAGVQPCGLPGDPACPATAPYCLTGCCIDFG